MTVPKWDANKWQQNWAQRHGAPPAPRKGRLKGALVLGGTAVLLIMAAAVNATDFGQAEEKIAICHATGSAGDPYRLLHVSKSGYEHGHHRHHDADFFPEDVSEGCTGYVPPAGNATGNGTGNETVPADNDTAPADNGSAGNETAPADNTTPPADNATNETAPPANDTVNETVTPPGDASVRQWAWQDDFEVVLTMEVRNVGEGSSTNVTLGDSLPDVRRTWYLGGADSSDCTLHGRDLSCWFGDLAPGESAMITLRAYTDRMPCGFSLTNTAYIQAVDDAESRNNAASASILARAC